MASKKRAPPVQQTANGTAKYTNEILKRLDPEVIDRLELRPIHLPVNHEIEFPGQRINHLFFIESGIASMTATFKGRGAGRDRVGRT